MKSNLYNLRYCLFIFYIFCCVFTPDFFSISIRHIILLISLFIILFNLIKYKNILISKTLYDSIILFIPFFIYLLIVIVFKIMLNYSNINLYLSTFTTILNAILTLLVVGEGIYLFGSSLKLTLFDYYKVLICVISLQFICVLLAFLVPSIREFFNSLIIQNSYSERLAQLATISNSGLTDRAYGLSNNLFDSFGVITAILINLTFIYGVIKNRTVLIVLSLFMVFIPAINSRTGLLFTIMGFVISLVLLNDKYKAFRNFMTFILFIIVFFMSLSFLPENTMAWINAGVEEFLFLLNGRGYTGTLGFLFSDNIKYPDNLLVGDGSFYSTIYGLALDNGYINCIWAYGIVGTILLFIPYIFIFANSFLLSKTKLTRCLVICMSIFMVLYLFKVYPLNNFGLNALVYGLLIYILNNNSNLMVSIKI